MPVHERARRGPCLQHRLDQRLNQRLNLRLKAALMAALQVALLGPMPPVTAASMRALSAASAPALPMAPCLNRGQQPRLTGRPNPRIALVTEADTRLGLGGVIARSGLAYLDRNQVPRDMWDVLTPFAPSSRLYERFLRITGVNHIAVERQRASTALAKALRQAPIPVLSRADLVGVLRQGRRLCVVQSRRYGSLGADLVIDASLGARVAHLAGVPFQGGFGPRELAHQSLALGWIFEVQGLSLQQLRALGGSLQPTAPQSQGPRSPGLAEALAPLSPPSQAPADGPAR